MTEALFSGAAPRLWLRVELDADTEAERIAAEKEAEPEPPVDPFAGIDMAAMLAGDGSSSLPPETPEDVSTGV